MPRAFRATRPKAFLAPLLLILLTSGCVSLELTESAKPFPGRRWPDAPTIAVAEARDRRPDPGVLGRVGWNSLKISGKTGARFRNTLMTSLNEHAYNVRYVGEVNVLDPRAVSAAVRQANADFLLTAAVLDIRAFSVDPFFDPADVDFTAQVNLLDPEGRTRYTRHIHVHEDRRLWFNPAFGARDMLDSEMNQVAEFVATDSELIRVVSEPRRNPVAIAGEAAPPVGSRPLSSTVPLPGETALPDLPPLPAPPPSTIPLSEIPEAQAPETAPLFEDTAPLPGDPPPAEIPAPENTAPAPIVDPPAETPAPEDTAPAPIDTPPAEPPAERSAAPTLSPSAPPDDVVPEIPPEAAPPLDAGERYRQEAPPEGTIAPDEEIVPPPPGRDPVFTDPGVSP